MKLSQYAQKYGVTYRTAWNRFKNGKLDGFIDNTNHIILNSELPVKKKDWNIVYSRVSSSKNKDNLIRQSERLLNYCNAKGWQIHEEIKEIGSGLNDNRPKLLKILEDGRATRIITEHKDRLARFGVSYIESACKHFGCELHIVNQVESEKEDLVQDFVSVITSFCSRIYGRRRSKRKTEKLIRELENDNGAVKQQKQNDSVK